VSIQRTFIAASEGAVSLGIVSNVGEVLVTVDPGAARARVVVSTDAAAGPSADVVRGAKAADEVHDQFAVMAVAVPDAAGIVTDAHTVTVHATLPPGSSVTLHSLFANLRVEGDLHMLSFTTTTGSVAAGGVNILTGESAEGAVTAASVNTVAKVGTGTGDVTIDAYGGHSLEVATVSGVVELTATEQASGPATVTTITSVARVHGASHVDLRGRSVTGRILPL
jgi:hypothetical protein